jgi:hypothetical protein
MSKLKSDEPEKEVISDSVRMLVNLIELMLEFVYMEEAKFMEDFRLAIVKSKIQEFSAQNVSRIYSVEKLYTQEFLMTIFLVINRTMMILQ